MDTRLVCPPPLSRDPRLELPPDSESAAPAVVMIRKRSHALRDAYDATQTRAAVSSEDDSEDSDYHPSELVECESSSDDDDTDPRAQPRAPTAAASATAQADTDQRAAVPTTKKSARGSKEVPAAEGSTCIIS
jgi:hypothetical protein